MMSGLLIQMKPGCTAKSSPRGRNNAWMASRRVTPFRLI